MQLIKASNRKELEQLSYFLHDSWLDVDSLEFDDIEARLQVVVEKELSEGRQRLGGWIFPIYKIPIYKFVLTVADVISYELDDTEKIGRYDICRITFDPVEGLITFHTGVALHFVVQVNSLSIMLVRFAEPEAWRQSRSFFRS